MKFVSRGGIKMAAAIEKFQINVSGMTCADLGCSTGGFTDCLLQNGANKVYAVDTAYGVLEWKLRKDARVVVMERTNALHLELPELVDLVTIDASWTLQRNIIPKALGLLKPQGLVISLVKPHYEADKSLLVKGRVPDEKLEEVMSGTIEQLQGLPLIVKDQLLSPIVGAKGGNKEFLLLLQKAELTTAK